METSVQNLADYSLQRTGGHPHYSDRKGLPQLASKHSHFSLTIKEAERWLDHMESALEALRADIQAKHRYMLLDFMRYTAYFFVVVQRRALMHFNAGPLF